MTNIKWYTHAKNAWMLERNKVVTASVNAPIGRRPAQKIRSQNSLPFGKVATTYSLHREDGNTFGECVKELEAERGQRRAVILVLKAKWCYTSKINNDNEWDDETLSWLLLYVSNDKPITFRHFCYCVSNVNDKFQDEFCSRWLFLPVLT